MFRPLVIYLDLPDLSRETAAPPLSHPAAYGQRKFAAHRPPASIGRKIIEILKNRQNLQDPPKIYRYGYLRVGLCISNSPHPKILLLFFFM